MGVAFGNPDSVKWDVGIGFTSQNGGPIVNASIRDDSTAATSLLINGTHATAAISIADGAGNIVFGTSTGTKIGTATSQKLSFWNATPAAQQVLATGTGKTVDNVITFLQSVGLCRQS